MRHWKRKQAHGDEKQPGQGQGQQYGQDHDPFHVLLRLSAHEGVSPLARTVCPVCTSKVLRGGVRIGSPLHKPRNPRGYKTCGTGIDGTRFPRDRWGRFGSRKIAGSPSTPRVRARDTRRWSRFVPGGRHLAGSPGREPVRRWRCARLWIRTADPRGRCAPRTLVGRRGPMDHLRRRSLRDKSRGLPAGTDGRTGPGREGPARSHPRVRGGASRTPLPLGGPPRPSRCEVDPARCWWPSSGR